MFLDELDLRSIRGTDSFLLMSDLRYLYRDKLITAKAGLITDFATIPKKLQGFLSNDAGCVRDAAVIHDWIYATHELPRHVADMILRKGMIELGAKRYQAWIVYVAVRLFGNAYWDKNNVYRR